MNAEVLARDPWSAETGLLSSATPVQVDSPRNDDVLISMEGGRTSFYDALRPISDATAQTIVVDSSCPQTQHSNDERCTELLSYCVEFFRWLMFSGFLSWGVGSSTWPVQFRPAARFSRAMARADHASETRQTTPFQPTFRTF
jgi:hypothetical protein